MPNPGKRDPFVSPIAAAAMRGSASNCSTGKHCLIVDQIVLKGIVQMKEGNFALVENVARRPYVLREKDALFNGTVEKITGDSVVFHETGSDILGRTTSKEVVKKVSAPAV
jgi:type II secretory pathway component PulC